MLDKKENIVQIIHDLKNPLNSIKVLTDIFIHKMSEGLNEKQTKILKEIQGQTEFTLMLVEDLLDEERLSQNSLSLEREILDLPLMLEEFIARSKPAADNKEIKLELQCENNIKVNVDLKRFERIFINLIDNAIKFSHPRNKVEISAKRDNDIVFIKVKDFGVGMKEEEVPKIFNSFSQVSSHPTENEKGTGLGLSIVYKLVKLHGGEIFVETKENIGTVFTIKFPVEV